MPDIDRDRDRDRDRDTETDDLDLSLTEDGDTLVVEGLTGALSLCAALREHRLAAGLSVAEVAGRCECDAAAIEWVDDGDVAAPVEALVYYAAALGLGVGFSLGG